MAADSDPVIVEENYQAPRPKVWQAITEPRKMRQWYFAVIPDFEPTVGFETEFDIECEGKTYPHLWKVLEVVPEEKLVVQWRYGGYPGDSTVTWQLADTADGTHLKLTHQGHETFPQDDPVFSRESCRGGWEWFLHQRLKVWLEEPPEPETPVSPPADR